MSRFQNEILLDSRDGLTAVAAHDICPTIRHRDVIGSLDPTLLVVLKPVEHGGLLQRSIVSTSRFGACKAL